jgi:hypothetical protein
VLVVEIDCIHPQPPQADIAALADVFGSAIDDQEIAPPVAHVAFVAHMKLLEIGRLGAYDVVLGYYAYVGSDFGVGGLRARIGQHLKSTATAPLYNGSGGIGRQVGRQFASGNFN